MKSIVPNELYGLLLTQTDATVLDVRTPVEYQARHAPRTWNVPLNSLRPQSLLDAGKIAKGRPVYLLCRAGARATLAAQQLASAGFEEAVVVEGGLQAWERAGLPIERAEEWGISLERQVRIAAGALVLTSAALGWWVHPGFFGLSAFVGAGLVFAGITDWCGMGLLLAKLPWNNRPVI